MFIIPLSGRAQMDCRWDPNSGFQPPPPSFDPSINCTPRISFDDYSLTSNATVYVNFHFVENWNPAVGVPLVQEMVRWINDQYLDALELAYAFTGTAATEHDYVIDLKRLEVDLLIDNRDWYSLNAGELATLNTIAQQSTQLAGRQAQLILMMR